MNGSNEEKNTYYRLTPCPAYDVEGMESWLENMAEQGLFLTSDGFFFGFGFFHKEEPRKAKYRLQASEVQGGLLSDGDEPEAEQKEISETLGWEFVARRGDFFIYRSMSEDVRELNSDPKVQAITMKMVQKRQYHSIISSLLWLIIYPLLKKKAIIVPMLYMKTWFFLFSIVLVSWFFSSSVWKLIHYTKLRNKLKKGEQLNREKNWKKKAWQYPTKILIQIVLCCIWVFIFLGNIHREVLYEEEISLSEYTGNPPFATMEDLGLEQFYELKPISHFNTVTEWSDFLAPVNFIWEEYAETATEDGVFRAGLWDINYHELRFAWMTKILAKDYMRMDQERDFELIGELELGVDYAVAYLDDIHMPRIILCEGNKVLYGSFHEYSNESEKKMSIEEWATILAESIMD